MHVGAWSDVDVIGRRFEERNGGWSVDGCFRPGPHTKCFLTQAPNLVIAVTLEGKNWKEKRLRVRVQAHIVHLAKTKVGC
jgi:hypothetical protein